MRRLLLAVIALVACGRAEREDPPAPETPTCVCESRSGSRLRVVRSVYQASDGSRFSAPTGTFFDRERDEQCRFQSTGAGGARCLPTDSYSTYEFVDADCTQPLVSISARARRPRYLLAEAVDNRASGACWTFTPRAAIHRVESSPVPAPSRAFRRDSDGACVETSVGPSADNTYFVAGAPLPWDSFVGAAADATCECSEGNGSRLKLRRGAFRGADGSSSAGPYVTTLDGDRECSVVALPGGARCVPPARETNEYADAACTQPVLVIVPSECPSEPPKFLRITDGAAPACGLAGARFFRDAGEEPLTTTTYKKNNLGSAEECVPARHPGGTTIVRTGEELPLSSFPSVTISEGELSGALYEERFTPGTRLRRAGRALTSGDGTSWNEPGPWGAARVFWDRELSTYVHPVGDLFLPGFAMRAFADATCTKPLVGFDGCDPIPRYATIQLPSKPDGSIDFQFLSVGPRYEGELFQQWTDGTCTATRALPGQRFAEVVGEVPRTTFVSYTHSEEIE